MPDSFISTIVPATFTSATRALSELATTETMTTPPPIPAGGVARIQETPLAAVHAQVDGALTPHAADVQRAGLKRQVRDVASAVRNIATGMRRRMHARSIDDAQPHPTQVTSSVPGAPIEDVARVDPPTSG